MLDTKSDSDLRLHSNSNSDLDKHITFLPIEYDPSIDPENMSQYLSKNYKVKEFFEKELIMDSNSDSKSQLDLPPPYIEQQKLKTKHSPPPYEQFEEDADESTNSNNDKRKRNWSAAGYCFIWLLILYFLQDGMAGNYMDCHGQDDNDGRMLNRHDKHHNVHYNKATIVYSLTSDELKVDSTENSN